MLSQYFQRGLYLELDTFLCNLSIHSVYTFRPNPFYPFIFKHIFVYSYEYIHFLFIFISRKSKNLVCKCKVGVLYALELY